MTTSDEKDRDNWARVTLRLPPSIHQQLLALRGPLSLNSSIVQRLEESLTHEAQVGIAQLLLEQALKEKQDAVREMEAMTATLETALETRERSLKEGVETGRKLALEDIGELIKKSVREAIAESLNRKNEEP